MSQIQLRIGILLTLVIISITLFLFDSQNESVSYKPDLFQIQDTSSIASIRIEGKQNTVHIEKSKDDWVLNDSLSLDPALISVIQAILNQVNITRPLSSLDLERVKGELITSGQKITIEFGGDKMVFHSGGNLQKTQSYFADENLKNIYLIAIPGYSNYVSGIFELTINQWRNRILFNSDFRSLQSLSIKYADSTELSLRFVDRFFQISGLQKLDTAIVTSYINSFEAFQVNDYLSKGDFPRYDSLSETRPIAHLSLKDIDQSKNQDLDIYPKIKGENFYLVTDSRKDMLVIDEQRMRKVLVRPNNFRPK